MPLLFLTASLTVLISGACSLLEAVLYSTRIGALEAERASGRHFKQASLFIGMKGNIAQPTSAILVLNTVANTAGAAICGMYATQILGMSMVPVVSVVLTLAILFVGEILPKTYGATHWQSLWHLIAWPLTVLQRALAPVIKVTQGFANFFSGSRGAPSITEDEIRANIRLGRTAGELSAVEIKLLDAVFRFDEMCVRQVMVPRKEVAFLDSGWTPKKCVEVVSETRHTRFPLCRGSLDEVIGLIHVKDLLAASREDASELQSLARPLRHVPETLPISRLMYEMQSTHQHMALVDDEYGLVIGIVTLENVVEQIVGTIQDEFDSEVPDIASEGFKTFRVSGQTLVERLNRECGLDLYSPDVETLSGLLVSQLGRLLEVGERVQLRGATAEVLEVENGHATVVRIRMANDGRDDA